MKKFPTKKLKMTSDVARLRGEKVDSIINNEQKRTFEVKLDKYYGNEPTCLILPNKDDDSYHKNLIECWVSLGKNIMSLPNKEVPHEIYSKIQEISFILDNITLSESWKENDATNFSTDLLKVDLDRVFYKSEFTK